MDAAYSFAKNFIKTEYESVPSNSVEVVKKHTLDLLGVALAGSSKPGIKELNELYTGWGGKEESTVICMGSRMPAPHAAQINATMGHALDYDDTHDLAVMHPSVIAVPTCLAMSEYIGGLNGRRYIAAAAAAMDMICRLGLATTSPLKAAWHLTTLNGFMTAAATAGSILGLNEQGIVNAIGIGYHQASGNGQCVLDGTLTKRMGPGFAVRGGIMAALMAQKGITGAENCFEGEYGLFKLYHNGFYNSKALTADIGTYFECANISIKPYPCCRGVHAYIDAAEKMVKEHYLQPGDIARITIICSKVHDQVLCSPLEVKCNPRNLVDAQFSTPWGVAAVIAEGKVSLEHFTEAAIHNSRIKQISARIRVEIEDNPAITHVIEPGKVRITTTDGRSYYQQIDHALGSPQWPLSYERCAEKFLDCALYSARPIPQKNLKQVINLIRHLETVQDVRDIIRLLS